MGVYRQLEDLERVFQTLTIQPTLVNYLSNATKEDKEKTSKILYTSYNPENDVLVNIPSCDCGHLTDVINADDPNRPGQGVICDKCGSPCIHRHDQPIEPVLWVQTPEQVRSFINPDIFKMLCDVYTKSGFSIIRYLTDTRYKSESPKPLMLQALESELPKRGWNSFIENFFEIISKLIEGKCYTSYHKAVMIRQICLDNRDILFPAHLPFPNKLLLVLENVYGGAYADPISPFAIAAATSVVGIDLPSNNDSAIKRQDTVARMMDQMAQFNTSTDDLTLGKPSGLFRKNFFATRANWTGRAVCSSITRPHHYEEIEIPYAIALELFSLHLAGRMLAEQGMSPLEITERIDQAYYKSDPLINSYFERFIHEAPEHRIPCTVLRNPSLGRGSVQLFGIGRIKFDPLDPTIAFPILDVTGPNLDYDGDEITIMLPVDNYMTSLMYWLKPHQAVFDLQEPFSVGPTTTLPKEFVVSAANWLQEHEDEMYKVPSVQLDIYA